MVNVFALPAGTKAATVPNLQDLPPDRSPVTSLAVLSRGSVACGHQDGSVGIVHLTGKQVGPQHDAGLCELALRLQQQHSSKAGTALAATA